MRQRKGPPVKKFSYYLPIPTGEAFVRFSNDAPSEQIPGAEIAWMSLPADAREAIVDASRNLSLEKAIAVARRAIRNSVGNQILLEHSHSLPKAEQARIVQESLAGCK